MYALKEDLITAKHYDKQFKIDAVNYKKNHPELTMAEAANNLGISLSSIHRWIKEYSSNNDDESKVFRGSGNYSSDDAKELVLFLDIVPHFPYKSC